jgi:hypothetical protein
MRLTVDTESIGATIAELRSEVRKGRTLREAAQRLMERFVKEFAESVVLARTYATVSYGILPARDREFARSLANARGMADALTDETRILSLLGTSGTEATWHDPYCSREHLAIPLFSEQVVSEIPMVAALIRQLGNSVSWFERLSPSRNKGEGFDVFTESFFVRDPEQTRDLSGRLLIPAQEFVARYGIKSVFGVGGEFLTSRIILACIFFSRQDMEETPPWLLRLPVMLATATRDIVSEGAIYERAEPV